MKNLLSSLLNIKVVLKDTRILASGFFHESTKHWPLVHEFSELFKFKVDPWRIRQKMFLK
jgi:hypothetical protein